MPKERRWIISGVFLAAILGISSSTRAQDATSLTLDPKTAAVTVSGELAEGDAAPMGTWFDLYSVDGVPGTMLKVDVVTTAFSPIIVVMAPGEGESVHQGSTFARPVTQSGTWMIGVSTTAAERAGPYELSIHFEGGAPAEKPTPTPVALQVGPGAGSTVVEGTLAQGDEAPAEGWLDRYTLQARTGTTLTVEVATSSFTPMIVALPPGQEAIVFNEPSFSSPVTSDGAWVIAVTTPAANVGGPYRLSASLAEPRPPSGTQPFRVTGTWDPSDPENTSANDFMTEARAGDVYDLRVISPSMQPMLILSTPDGNNHYGAEGSVRVTVPTDGTLIIFVRGGDARGDYVVEGTITPAPTD
jgi:hypothetical protein